MSDDLPGAAVRLRQNLGPFHFGNAVRDRIAEVAGWTANAGEGAFTFKFAAAGEEIRRAIGDVVNVQYWVGRQQSKQPYVSFEFHPDSKSHPGLAASLASDLRSFLRRIGATRSAEILESEGNTVMRVRVRIDPNATEFSELEVTNAVSLWRFVATHIEEWRATRLGALLRQALGTSDALDDLTIAEPDLEKANPTQRMQLIYSRIGQGQFRESLISYWGMCAVTGIVERSVLRASHIQRWCNSSDLERLDPLNGLLLTANLDALFEVGKISFDDTGKIVISDSLSHESSLLLGVHPEMRLRQDKFCNQHRQYLIAHRNRVGLR